MRGIVILVDSSRIGPGHGTEHVALAYRVTATAAIRQPLSKCDSKAFATPPLSVEP